MGKYLDNFYRETIDALRYRGIDAEIAKVARKGLLENLHYEIDYVEAAERFEWYINQVIEIELWEIQCNLFLQKTGDEGNIEAINQYFEDQDAEEEAEDLLDYSKVWDVAWDNFKRDITRNYDRYLDLILLR